MWCFGAAVMAEPLPELQRQVLLVLLSLVAAAARDREKARLAMRQVVQLQGAVQC